MTELSASQNEVSPKTSIPEVRASLESILWTEELERRPSRSPDYDRENRALVKLVSALADSPSTIFQTLADTILDITQCDSAGLSLLTRDGKTPDVCGKRFYWPAIAGMWYPHVGGGTPRNFGPCGDVLDQNRTLLFKHFERRYTYFLPITPLIEECLLVPFYVAGKAVGTIWAIMHSDRRKFDAEDDRVMASLGKFASSAYQALVHIEDLKIQVAEREKAEAEIRELASGLEAKFRRLVAANVVGIVMWNLEGAITEANEAFLHMVQYTREDIACGRVRWTDLTPAEWRDRDERAIADLKATGVVQPFEKEYFRKDGSRVPVLLGGAFFEGSGNEGVAFVLDLTEQKLAEDKLRQSETLLQAFFGNTPNLVFLKDRQGRYLYINKEFMTVFPITQDQIRGKRDDEIFSAEQAAAFQTHDRQVLEAGVPMEFEETFQQEDEQHIGIVQKFPLFNAEGEIYAIGGVVTDITERKREESARRYSEERYRVVVETASDAVVCMDENGTISFANPATTAVFGYEPTELIGKPLTVLMPDDVRKLYEKGLKAYLATGERRIDPKGTEFRGLRKDGQEFPVEVALGELTSSGQRVFTGFIRDISERKRAEVERERLRQVQADLLHINRVSTMGELTAALAHEVKQPISAAVTDGKTFLRWLNRDQPDLGEAREAASRLIKDVERASEIISRIGSLFKKDIRRREMVDVNEIIREMIVLLRSEAARYSISIDDDLAEDLPEAMVDRVQLQQVLMNLMLNGIEAMKDLGTPGRLRITSRPYEDRQLLISVADLGVGIRPEQLEQIFNAFFTSKVQGTGMGLPISRSIVESHGGRLWATPHSGPGSTFQFTLPIGATEHGCQSD